MIFGGNCRHPLVRQMRSRVLLIFRDNLRRPTRARPRHSPRQPMTIASAALKRRLGVERGRIEHDGVLGRDQGRRGAAFVALIALDNLGEHGGVIGRFALRSQLQGAARGAHFGARRDKYFGASLGTDYGANIAAIKNGAAGPARKTALEFDERRTDLGDCGDNRRRFRHLAAAQQSFVETGERKAPRGGNRGIFRG